MQSWGEKINLLQLIIYFLQNLLLQTGPFQQAEEAWQWILTYLHERENHNGWEEKKKKKKKKEERK